MTGRRVVVTGMGSVTAAGIGVEALWAAARDGQSCVGPLDVRQPYGGRIKISAQVRDFDTEERLGPEIAPFADAFAAYALVAADEALHQAGLTKSERQGTQVRGPAGDRHRRYADDRRRHILGLLRKQTAGSVDRAETHSECRSGIAVHAIRRHRSLLCSRQRVFVRSSGDRTWHADDSVWNG